MTSQQRGASVPIEAPAVWGLGRPHLPRPLNFKLNMKIYILEMHGR